MFNTKQYMCLRYWATLLLVTLDSSSSPGGSFFGGRLVDHSRLPPDIICCHIFFCTPWVEEENTFSVPICGGYINEQHRTLSVKLWLPRPPPLW